MDIIFDFRSSQLHIIHSKCFVPRRSLLYFLYVQEKIRKTIAYDESTIDLPWPWDSVSMLFCHAMYDVDFSGLLDLQRVTPCVYCH